MRAQLETLAVAMYESHVRRYGGTHAHGYSSWGMLNQVTRDEYRHRAMMVMTESTDLYGEYLP